MLIKNKFFFNDVSWTSIWNDELKLIGKLLNINDKEWRRYLINYIGKIQINKKITKLSYFYLFYDFF